MNGLYVIVLTVLSLLSESPAGLVIDRYNPRDDSVLLSEFYGLWRISMSGMHPDGYESAAWITKRAGGRIYLQYWGRVAHANMQQWIGKLPADAIGVVHTHCRRVRPQPSKPDLAVSKKLGIPVYVVNDRGIWKGLPDDIVVQWKGPGWWKQIEKNK